MSATVPHNREHMLSLNKRSAEIRAAKAGIKREISEMPRDRAFARAIDILENPVMYEDSLYVDELLMSVPYIGANKCLYVMSDAQVPMNHRRVCRKHNSRNGVRVRVKDLTDAQKGRLVMRLEIMRKDAVR